MKKKILSIALALCMVLTMMPMATGVAWADPATSVTVGGKTLNSETRCYHNGEGGAVGTIDNTETGANAIFDATTGTLTLKGLSLSDSENYCIYANIDLNIVLEGGEGNANSLVHSYKKNIIYVEGNLTISGSGTLTAENGSSAYTTIYAKGDITINDGAVVNATHAGGEAQAINAEKNQGAGDASIVISGEGTTVTATYSGTDQTNGFALKADSINVSSGATLTATATSGIQAVSGDVSIDTANSDVYAGDSAPGTKLENINSTAKYLNIVPKALEARTFRYAYDAQRAPDFPNGTGDLIFMSELNFPLNSSGQRGDTNSSSWKLTKVGTYSFVKNSNLNSQYLDGIVTAVFSNYKVANPSLQKDAIVIHELKDGETHIAYGVVIAYDAANGTAVFIGDKWSVSGACYLLSTNEISNSSSYTDSNPLIISAGTIATDFVQKLSIDLDHTDTHTFTSQTTETVKITNTGNDETGSLTVNLSGEYASSFILGKDETSGATISISSIAKDGNDTFTVAPKADLEAGTYTATVTVIGQNIVDKSFDVSFKVKAPSSSGSYTPTIQKPTVITDDGVEGTLSFYGDKLTIKVTDDYELADVILNGVSKGKVTELTGLKTGDKVEVKTEKKQEEPKEPTKEEIVAALKEQQLVARSKLTTSKSGRKAVLITWYDKNGNEVTFDGVEIYRSTKRDSGYGDEPIFVSKTGKYYNTAITEGTRYYYKVRGYAIIDGQKYYTDYSLKAIRTIK